MPVQVTVGNAGPAPSAATWVGFFLSPEGGGASVAIGTRSVGGLAAFRSMSAAPGLPATVSPGRYVLEAVVDDQGRVAERDEGNNRLAAATVVTVVPNVQRTFTATSSFALSACSDAALDTGASRVVPVVVSRQDGPQFTASFTVTPRVGGAGVSITFTLSGTVDTAGGLGGTFTMVGRRGGRVFLTGAGTLSGTVSGTSLSLALTGTAESTTGATCQLSTGLIGNTDLTVTQVSAPATGFTGLPIVITDVVTHTGVVAAPASRVAYYLSPDGTLGEGARLLGTRAVAALGGGRSSNGRTTVTVPADVAAGRYRVVVVADALGAVQEADEDMLGRRARHGR